VEDLPRADASYNNNCSTSCPKERKQTVLNANNPFSDSGKYFFEYDALALRTSRSDFEEY
jgi:hemolysin activation/secretion protein